MSKSASSFNRPLMVVLAVVLFVAVNVLATSLLTSSRIDLTEDRLYSLSDGTRNIIKSLAEPITLRFFFSEKVATPYPALRSYGERVRNLLQEYESLSGGKIRVVLVNPEPFSPAEDDAVAAGLRAVQTNSGDSIYFGLVATSSVDSQQVIPYFAPERERYLEYDLSKLVADLSKPEKPVVGLITSLPLEYGLGGPMAMAQGQSAPYVIYEQLRQSYSMRNLGSHFGAIDKEIDMLLIVHPGDLGEEQLYAIDQYVLNGGKVVAFVDPFYETANMMQQVNPMMAEMSPPSRSSLKRLMAAWGVEMLADKVVADRRYAQRVSVPDLSGNRSLKDYVPWLAVPEEGMARDDLITGELKGVNLASAGSLRVLEGATTRVEPLLRSSNETMLLDAQRLNGMVDPEDLLREFKADGESHTLAVRISGKSKSAFAEAPDGGEAKGSHLAESRGDIHVVVVADADLFEDQFWVQVQSFAGQRVAIPHADNGALVSNAVDVMSGSSDLISLRSRGVSQRPFTLVNEIRREAEAKFLAEEQRLQARVRETEQQIRAAEQGQGGSDAAWAEADAIESFRQELLNTRKELRNVQHNLQSDIERLGKVVAFLNIGLMPIVVAIAAVILAAWRRRRRAVRV